VPRPPPGPFGDSRAAGTSLSGGGPRRTTDFTAALLQCRVRKVRPYPERASSPSALRRWAALSRLARGADRGGRQDKIDSYDRDAQQARVVAGRAGFLNREPHVDDFRRRGRGQLEREGPWNRSYLNLVCGRCVDGDPYWA